MRGYTQPKQQSRPLNVLAPVAKLALSEAHRRTLIEGSAIDPDILAEAGARTITRGGELPEVFSKRQRARAPGIMFDVDRPNGQTSWSFRPDTTGPDDDGPKYEVPPKSRGGPGNVLGILRSQRHLVADPSAPVVFVEGTKKQLSLITAARKAGVRLLVVAVIGCWNFLHDGGKPIPDLADLALDGRRATIMYDSDMLTKAQVQGAVHRFAEYLEGRGAEAYVTYFRDLPDGSKCGADDFFVHGGTLAELRLLTRRYDPKDFTRVRLSRDERLRGMVEDLHRTYAAMPATKQAELSMRAAVRHIIPRAQASGKVTDGGGILVHIPTRWLANAMRASQETARKTLRRLAERGYLERVEEPPRKTEKHGALYLLYAQCTERTESCQHREGRQQHNVSQEQGRDASSVGAHRDPLSYAEFPRGDYSPCAPQDVPELRSSKIIHTWARRDGRAVVVSSEYVYRLGKAAWEIITYLLDRGGAAADVELLGRFGTGRTVMRNFRRRRISPLLGYRYSEDRETGIERRVEIGPPIVSYEGGEVRILPEWRSVLEEHRRATDEDGDTRRQAERYREQSRKYRKRDRRPADEQPSPLLGKERVRRMTAEPKRSEAARTARRHKARQYARETYPNATLWRERQGRTRQAKHQAKTPVAAPDPERRMPPKVDGVYVHGPLCDCWLCAEDPAEQAARYVKLRPT